MAYIYEVFEWLHQLWMGIWLHTHTVTTTKVSPGLWELAEILPDASMQTMPLHFGWGCRTSQTASYVHVIHIWGVWAPSQASNGHLASHSHWYHDRHFPRLVRVGWNTTWCKLQTMPLHFSCGCRTFQTESHVHVMHIWCVWASSQVLDGHKASYSNQYHQRHSPRLVRVGWCPTWCKCANHATIFILRLWNLSNCIPCPCHTYMRCGCAFSGCG